MNRLEEILATTRQQLPRRRRVVPESELEQAAAARAGEMRSFAGALAAPGLSLIAEHKRRSPSAGAIREELALEQVVGAYQRGGAAAVSVLTEESSFGGSLDDLRAARAASRLPILRKDFIVEEYQLLESAAVGADAVLLIVAALSEQELIALHERATALGMAALVEVHDEHELGPALAAGARLIGINNRDLSTLAVDSRRAFELLPRIPQEVVSVVESGLRSREELDQLADAGADAVLVGESLMRAGDIEAACRALTSR